MLLPVPVLPFTIIVKQLQEMIIPPRTDSFFQIKYSVLNIIWAVDHYFSLTTTVYSLLVIGNNCAG